LKISLKERKRYLVFELISDEKLKVNQKQIIEIISKQLLKLYGEIGASRTHFWLHSFDPVSRKGLIEYRNETSNLIRSSLSSITEIENMPVILNTLGISGTIKTARRKYLKN
jgi:ribonuclease P/MRP protein subunit POP5